MRKKKQKKRKLPIIAAALAVSSIMSVCAVSASAIDINAVTQVKDIRASSYSSLDVRVGSAQLKVPAKMI